MVGRTACAGRRWPSQLLMRSQGPRGPFDPIRTRLSKTAFSGLLRGRW